MDIALWAVQIVLGLTFAGSGLAKSVMSKQRMIATGQTGVTPFPLPVIRVVTLLEVAGAVAILLPWWTGIAPVLTPVAAVCFVALMVGAAGSHWSLGEYAQVFAVNAVLAAMAVFVAVGRFPAV